MRITEMTQRNPNMGSTRTYEDFSKWLGSKPHRLGLYSSLYEDLTASYLTETLKNIVTMGKSPNKFQNINNFMFEWDVDVNYVKRVEFAAAPVGDGAGGSEITFAFRENYYQRNDTFRIEGSRQLVFCKTAPVKKADNYWEIRGQLIDSDFTSILDASYCQPGAKTRFFSNYQSEFSIDGYTKYQSNLEKHRNYISFHRNDDSYTTLYSRTEDLFVKIAYGKDEEKERVFKLPTIEKNILDNFLQCRNNSLVFGKTNVDASGKSTIVDNITGYPVYMGDGIIPQLERYGTKYGFAKITIPFMERILSIMRQKKRKPTGNVFTFIVNEILWDSINSTLRDYLNSWKTIGTFMFSEKANKEIEVGNNGFYSYSNAGNTIQFIVDRSLTLEYEDRGYGICVDLTADATTGTPAMSMFTIEGLEFKKNYIEGVGLKDGPVSSPTTAHKVIMMGYAGIGVFNPYKSVIIEEQKVSYVS